MRLRFEATDRCFGRYRQVMLYGLKKQKKLFDMVRLGDASFFDKMRSKLNRN